MAGNYTAFSVEIDSDGWALVTWDMPDRSINLITLTVMEELDALIDQITQDAAIKGAILISAKPDSFTGGADITMIQMLSQSEGENSSRDLFEKSSSLSRLYRKLETCGKPIVVAINGTCLGGGTELALAAHGRIMVDDRATTIGLPEVRIGIFPGAGGTQRLMRMTDPQSGLQMLLQGKNLSGKKAKSMGLVDVLVPQRSDLVPVAKKMLAEGLSAQKPWDQKGYKPSGAANIYSPAGFQLWPAANALYRKETHDNYPGARGIMKAVYEGLQLPMDQALAVESRYFASVLQTPEASNMLRSLFVSLQALNKGARRPANIAPVQLETIGIVGAGFMGAGIAHVSARAGLRVVLLDRTLEAAEKGKAHSDGLMQKAVKRGYASQEEHDALMTRITTSTDYPDLAGCDLVIEAVFEDRDTKADVIASISEILPVDVTLASNTSTLPINSLAQNHVRPENFIGIHFFSPVDKMMLVEIILGEQTNDQALACAFDFVRLIRKTPIVVNDGRGFYANRSVMAYLLEAHLLLTEGIPAAMIENLAVQAGMPIGPLALTDEVAVDLAWKILQATKTDLGPDFIHPAQEKLLQQMVVELERFGRKNGKGFYDYDGRDKQLWPGLSDLVPQLTDPDQIDQIDHQEIRNRLLMIQALEAARCFEEGVITDVREADLGSILGFGFAPFTGGTLSFIDTMGPARFVAACDELTEKHGPRFAPNDLLRELAASGDTFYGRFTEAFTSVA
ncbi:MAG: 3-hydroxyacyl-CoA dehydrogenase NAD-binding domain-containing protein [Hyphomicrobiales bacterium]